MNRTIVIISLLATLTACEAPDHNPLAPIESATEDPTRPHICSDEPCPMPPDETSGETTTSTNGSESSGSSDDTTTSTGPVEPGPCAAYLGCVDVCADEACREACASVTGVDVPYCEMLKCDELSDACANGDADACHRLPECAASESSSDSSGNSSDSGGSESSGSSDTSSSGESTT